MFDSYRSMQNLTISMYTLWELYSFYFNNKILIYSTVFKIKETILDRNMLYNYYFQITVHGNISSTVFPTENRDSKLITLLSKQVQLQGLPAIKHL